MKTISIRDLRQRWPKAEKALEIENEIVITRDGKPIAKLVRLVAPKRKKKRWDAEAHLRWMKKFWGNKVFPSSDAYFARERADR